MEDTQWARFEVFVQEKGDSPFVDVGSVHAPDAEMALMNARDVFARRPACIGMWVVPTECIFSRTIQELQGPVPTPSGSQRPVLPEVYYVSCKLKHAGAQVLQGSLEATSPEEALQSAVAKYSQGQAPLVWWVFPEHLVTRSNPADAASAYAPALDKLFRMSTDFHTVSVMQQIKAREAPG